MEVDQPFYLVQTEISQQPLKDSWNLKSILLVIFNYLCDFSSLNSLLLK